MRLAIYWNDILHYHAARIAALYHLAEEAGHTVHAFALRPASPELPIGGYHNLLKGKIEVLSQDPLADEYSSVAKQELLRALDETNPDAVAIVGYTGKVPRAALGWCRYNRRGAVLLFESQAKDYSRSRLKEWLKSKFVRLYDAALVGGRPHAEYAMALGMHQDHIYTGYDAVDNRFWLEEADRVQTEATLWQAHFGLPEHFFLTVSRFVVKKNNRGLINAYATYVKQIAHHPWPLVIVGDGELRPLLQQQVADLDLAHLIHFAGYLSAQDMAKLYGLASTFILASSHEEQWGLVVNEAMAAGLSVLVSNICGCVPDLVLEGKTGFTFDPHNEAQLAQLLLHVSSGSIDLADIGRNGQKRIQRFTPELFAKTLFSAAQLAIQYADNRRWQVWPPPSLWI